MVNGDEGEGGGMISLQTVGDRGNALLSFDAPRKVVFVEIVIRIYIH